LLQGIPARHADALKVNAGLTPEREGTTREDDAPGAYRGGWR
jgi:hypothetical protein